MGQPAETEVPRPPAKPKRWSERRYREVYDATPCTVVAPGARYLCAGPVSAYVIADSIPDARVVVEQS